MLFLRMSKLQTLKNATLALVIGLVLCSCGAAGGNIGSGLYCGGMFFGAAAIYALLFWLKVHRDRQPRMTTIPQLQEGPEMASSHPVMRSDLFLPDPLD